MAPLPRAILIDLDDTILSAYGRPAEAWARLVEEFAARLAPLTPKAVAAAIVAQAKVFWRDPADHKYWRHRLDEARARVVALAFEELAASDAQGVALAEEMALR